MLRQVIFWKRLFSFDDNCLEHDPVTSPTFLRTALQCETLQTSLLPSLAPSLESDLRCCPKVLLASSHLSPLSLPGISLVLGMQTLLAQALQSLAEGRGGSGGDLQA